MITDIENGFYSVHPTEIFDLKGQHGGPLRAEAEVPLFFNFLGVDKTFVRTAVPVPAAGATLRTRHMTPIVVQIIDNVRD